VRITFASVPSLRPPTARPRLIEHTACLIGLLAAVSLAAPQTARAQGRYALIVEGTSGEEQYAATHRQWVDKLATALKDKFKLEPSHLTILTEKPRAGESVANIENVKSALGKLAQEIKKDDTLFVMLIGHGSGSGGDAKFNLVGPDLTATEWNVLLQPISARVAFVDTTSASAGFLKGLAGPERVIITATNSPAQVYHPMFGEAFIDALTSSAADLDKNERISMWEAFVYASKTVEQHYQRAGTLATEHAVLDDTGQGTGRDASATVTGTTLASLTFLDAPAVTRSADPAVQALIDRREALNKQIDDLRRRQSSMPAAEFDSAFEKLILELSQVSAEIRKRSGG
jgi:hypothetical protein